MKTTVVNNPPEVEAIRAKLTPGWTEPHHRPMIFKALADAKRELPAVAKSDEMQVSRQGAKVSYRSFESIMNAVAPVLASNGIVLQTEILQQSQEKDGDKLFAKITKRVTFFAEDGSSVKSEVSGVGVSYGEKAMIIAQTVAMRIALCETLSIPFDEMQDPEAGPQHVWGECTATVSRIKEQLEAITDIKRLRGLASYVRACLNGEGKGDDVLDVGAVDHLIPWFKATGRKISMSDEQVKAMADYISGADPAGSTPENGDEVIETQRFDAQACRFNFTEAKDQPEKEDSIRVLLRSLSAGDVSQQEFADIVGEFFELSNEDDVAGFILQSLHYAETVEAVSTAIQTNNAASQQGRIERDTYMSLCKFATERTKALGGGQ